MSVTNLCNVLTLRRINARDKRGKKAKWWFIGRLYRRLTVLIVFKFNNSNSKNFLYILVLYAKKIFLVFYPYYFDELKRFLVWLSLASVLVLVFVNYISLASTSLLPLFLPAFSYFSYTTMVSKTITKIRIKSNQRYPSIPSMAAFPCSRNN